MAGSIDITWDTTWVTSVAFCGSARKLAAGNQDGQLILFDLPEKAGEPAKPVRRLDGHTNAVSGLAATPDGRWLVSASLDHSVRLWDLQAEAKASETIILDAKARLKAKKEAESKGKTIEEAPAAQVEVQTADLVLTEHKDWIRSMSLTPDGTRLLTGDDHGLAILWDLAGRKELRRLKVPGWLTGVGLTADGKRAVTCEFASRYILFPNAVRIWDLETGDSIRDCSKECSSALVGGWSPDGQLLAVGQGGEISRGKIHLIDASSGKKLGELPGHEGGVTGVLFHPEGKFLATCGRDTLARLWQTKDSKQLQQLGQSRGGQSKDWIHRISFSPDQRWLAGADMGGFVHVWPLES